MTTASKVNGIAFIILLSGMFIYSAPKLWEFGEREKQAVQLYRDGQLSRKFEGQYDSHFFMRESAIKAWSNLSYWLFNEGMTGVIVGHDGWLFTNEEFTFPNNLQARMDRQLTRVEKAAASLKQHGKQLIVVPIPMKVDIYGEHVNYALGNQPETLYRQFTQHLEQRDIPFAAVRDAYLRSKSEMPLFLKRDTHWTPEGARAAAQQLAREFPSLVGGEVYRSEVVRQTWHAGDLINFLKMSDWLDPELYAAEPLARYQTVKPSTSNDDLDAASLFGNETPPIVVVGSSYTKMDEWNFQGFLKESLKTDLLSVAIEQKGQFVAMDEFLTSDLLTDEQVKTVIWEFPVRSLISQASESSDWLTTMDEVF
jgi:alginate O-acetyltransferase complex protein AlgJ